MIYVDYERDHCHVLIKDISEPVSNIEVFITKLFIQFLTAIQPGSMAVVYYRKKEEYEISDRDLIHQFVTTLNDYYGYVVEETFEQ